jgi:hypothetical protein
MKMTRRDGWSDDPPLPFPDPTLRLFTTEKAQKHQILSNFTKNRAFNHSHPPIRQLEAHEAAKKRRPTEAGGRGRHRGAWYWRAATAHEGQDGQIN